MIQIVLKVQYSNILQHKRMDKFLQLCQIVVKTKQHIKTCFQFVMIPLTASSCNSIFFKQTSEHMVNH